MIPQILLNAILSASINTAMPAQVSVQVESDCDSGLARCEMVQQPNWDPAKAAK